MKQVCLPSSPLPVPPTECPHSSTTEEHFLPQICRKMNNKTIHMWLLRPNYPTFGNLHKNTQLRHAYLCAPGKPLYTHAHPRTCTCMHKHTGTDRSLFFLKVFFFSFVFVWIYVRRVHQYLCACARTHSACIIAPFWTPLFFFFQEFCREKCRSIRSALFIPALQICVISLSHPDIMCITLKAFIHCS